MAGEAVCGFGIELKPVQEHDLPLICQWRNDEDIRKYMDDTRSVSIEILKFWLKKNASSSTHFSFIACCNSQPVGFTELKKINFVQRACHDGIFLFGKKFMGHDLGHRILLCREIIMRNLGIDDLINSININNKRSLAFYANYQPKPLHKCGELQFYMYPLQSRRQRLAMQAERLGLRHEFDKYFSAYSR